MSIRYKCVGCGATMKIKNELAGTKGHCPQCKAKFVVPKPKDDEPVAVKAAESTAAAGESGELPTDSVEADEVAESLEKKTKVAESEDSEPEVEAKQEPVTEESLEDEYQRILMGDDGPGDRKSKRNEVDSDAFLSVDAADEDPADSRSDSDHGMRRSTPAPPPKPARTAAEISASMMKNTVEPTLKKSGKGFGESVSDKDSARNKMAAEARAYYGKQVGILVAGIVVIGGGLYWISSSMMGSAKHPPLARVYGLVTLDGKPLPGASVTLQPMLEGANKGNVKISGSAATTDTSGRYEVYYAEGLRGAVIGKHIVQVRAQSDIGLEMVPDKFNTNSQLTTEVKSGGGEYNIPLTKN